MEKFPAIVYQTIRSGHQIGYHSYYHNSLKEISISEVYRDIKRGERLLGSYDVNELLYRPPYGHLSLLSTILLIFRNWKIIMWSVEGRDSFDSQALVIQNLAVPNIHDGAIILYMMSTKILSTFFQIY